MIVETVKGSRNELPGRLLRQLEHFFVSYNAEKGKRFEVLARRGPRAATAVVPSAARRFQQGGARDAQST